MDNLIIPPALGILGMVMAFVVYKLVMKYPDGEDNVKKIGDQIHAGALAFMKTEYKYLSIFIAVIVLLAWYALGPYTAISIVVGAICSSVAGFIGLYAATKANVRTATAAQKDGPAAALSVSFYGGSIMGLCVASLGLIGLGGLYYFYIPAEIDPHKLEGFAMGASVVALFSRVGGGIFTKSADVGADLVGKIELVFLKMIQEIQVLLPTMLVIMLVMLLEWGRIYLSHIVVQCCLLYTSDAADES